MDKPGLRSVQVLEKILGQCEWLVGDEFSVADVAVASYLNYVRCYATSSLGLCFNMIPLRFIYTACIHPSDLQVPIFFPDADLSATPNIVRYMQRCSERPAFSKVIQSHLP